VAGASAEQNEIQRLDAQLYVIDPVNEAHNLEWPFVKPKKRQSINFSREVADYTWFVGCRSGMSPKHEDCEAL
jgi:hypothetical protein